MNARPGATTAPSVLAQARARVTATDLLTMFGLTVVAMVPRLTNLLTVPRFTDEQLEVLAALHLYQGGALPLLGPELRSGALHTYLVAAALGLFGPNPYVARLVSVLLGAATVPLTYLLGRTHGGRPAGLFAAALLVTCGTHILVNSRVAWSDAVTPFFVTLFFLSISGTVTRGSKLRLILSGLVFGLALQTDWDVLWLLPGVGLALAVRQRRLLRSRWLLVACLAFVLAYANVLIYYALPSAYRPLEDPVARELAQERAAAEELNRPPGYLANLGSLALNLPRVAASEIEPRPVWTSYLARPAWWVYGALLVLGLLWPLWRGDPLPVFATVSYGMLLALFQGEYEPIFDGRRLTPILPLAFAGFGSLLASLSRTMLGRGPQWALTVLGAGLALFPLVSLIAYQQRSAQEGQIDVDLIQTATALRNVRRPAEPVVVDQALGQRGLPGGGDLLQSLRVCLELDKLDYRIRVPTASQLEAELAGDRTLLVVLAMPYDRALEARFRFLQAEDRAVGQYGAFRLERRS